MKKILIIEDDSFLRNLIAEKLLNSGFQILEAVDAESAFEKIKEEIPDLIILDLLLPGEIDGFKFLSKIKENPETSFIPVIILSNLGQKEEVERGLNLGAIDYLIKAQFTLDEVVVKVKEILKENSDNNNQ